MAAADEEVEVEVEVSVAVALVLVAAVPEPDSASVGQAYKQEIHIWSPGQLTANCNTVLEVGRGSQVDETGLLVCTTSALNTRGHGKRHGLLTCSGRLIRNTTRDLFHFAVLEFRADCRRVDFTEFDGSRTIFTRIEGASNCYELALCVDWNGILQSSGGIARNRGT